MVNRQTLISPEIARQILLEAEENGVTVENYLQKIVEKNKRVKPKEKFEVRRARLTVDTSAAREWLDKNAAEYEGLWVVLDGGTLIGAGDNPTPFVKKARQAGVKIPFVTFINRNLEPFMGGWL